MGTVRFSGRFKVQKGSVPTTAKKFSGWRVLHKMEGGYQKTPLNMPEVIPPDNSVAIDMTRAIQVMSFDLMVRFNPAITPALWTKVHDWDRAFTNYQGFGDKSDPRVNFITGENIGADNPKYDKAQRQCGGNFLRGEVRGDRLVCVPGVHGINANGAIPDVDVIIERHWFLYAVTLFKTVDKFGHFPQGQGGPVVIPFIFDREISFPLAYFDIWEADTAPDPLRTYR